MGAHSFLPPSGAKAWSVCPMWATMNATFPQDDTPETLEGEAAHWVLSEALLTGKLMSEGEITPNGTPVTLEMIEGAELAAGFISPLMLECPTWKIEQSFLIPRIHKDCFGTPDFWSYREGVLNVVDYKFGHRFVDAFECLQLIAYAAGSIWGLADQLATGVGTLDQHLRVRFTIIQPRCYRQQSPIRTWEVHASDLRPYFNKLQYAAELATSQNPKAVTNPECRDCPGRHACQTLQEAAYSDSEYSSQSTPLELPPAAASLELRMMERALERLQSRVDGLRGQLVLQAKSGASLPHHALQQGYGRTTWTVSDAEVLSLGALYNVDLSKPGLKTPQQAKKLGIDDAVITAYSKTPMGEIKLIPHNSADARRVFG